MATGNDSILVFLHIPKTGGTTLEDYFYTKYDTEPAPSEPEEDGLLNGPIYHFPLGWGHEDEFPAARLANLLQRPDVWVFLGHFRFGIHELQSRPATYTTVLRDPVARVISLGAHDLRWSGEKEVPNIDLGELERHLLESDAPELDNGQTRRLAGINPPFGQCTTAMLERAKHNLSEHFSVVGLTERFDETIVLFSRVLGWELEHYNPSRQVNPHRLSSSDLSAGVIDAVGERNSLDVELHAFAAELFEAQVERQGSTFQDALAAFKLVRERDEA
jgi:Galactose-3-O-sulfotransferase